MNGWEDLAMEKGQRLKAIDDGNSTDRFFRILHAGDQKEPDALTNVWFDEMRKALDDAPHFTPWGYQLLTHRILWIFQENRTIPVNEQKRLLTLADKICRHFISHKIKRWEELTTMPFTLEVWSQLVMIYLRGADLVKTMRGAPLIYAQKVGDRRPLAAYIRHPNNELSPELRRYVADLIEKPKKKHSRAKNRHKTADSDRRNRAITWFILQARQNGVADDLSVENAVTEFGLGRRRIQEIFSEYKDREPSLLASTTALITQLEDVWTRLQAN
jgi:hypothetical protein